MRAEVGSFLFDFAQFVQRKDLVAAAIGKDGFVPSDKLMQSAEFGYYFFSRPKVQMVRIAEDYGSFHANKFARRNGFHRALGADRHKYRRGDRSMACVQQAGPSLGARSIVFQFEEFICSLSVLQFLHPNSIRNIRLYKNT